MIFWIIIGFSFIASLGWALGRRLRKARQAGRRQETWGDTLFTVAIATVVGAMAAFTVGFILASIKDEHRVYDDLDRAGLVAVLDQQLERSNLSGAFILIAGGVSGETRTELNYAWYERASNGAISARTGIIEDADTEVEIFYLDRGERPYVVHRDTQVDTSTPDWISPINLNPTTHYQESDQEVWELHVPRGSVVRDFKLDLR